MAEKDFETWLYTDKKITVKGQTYDVTLAFPVPDDESDFAEDKFKSMIDERSAS